MQNKEQGHHGLLLASYWLILLFIRLSLAQSCIIRQKRLLGQRRISCLSLFFVPPGRRKRGRKFAMTSSLQKCRGCWHVSNLLIMFHSHPIPAIGPGAGVGFSLVNIAVEAEATLPINKNCIEQESKVTYLLQFAMNLRIASRQSEMSLREFLWTSNFSSFLLLYKSYYTHPSKHNNDWLYWSTHHLMIPLCLDNPVI